MWNVYKHQCHDYYVYNHCLRLISSNEKGIQEIGSKGIENGNNYSKTHELYREMPEVPTIVHFLFPVCRISLQLFVACSTARQVIKSWREL